MKTNLVTTVTNILHKRVTEEQAKEYALNHFGELCTYIRNQHLDKFNIKPKDSSKMVKIKDGYIRVVSLAGNK